MNANVGILGLNGNGTHTGSFGGAATIRFDGGNQVLGTGANVTVADLEVDDGTLDVTPGASYGPANTDVTGGTLNVTDAADTITSTTATLTSGILGGPGGFTTTGSFGWTGGTMSGAGTTVTVAVHSEVFPHASVAVKVTVVVPVVPQSSLRPAKSLAMVTSPQVSSAVTDASHAAISATLPAPSHSKVASSGQVMAGAVVSSTVTVAEQVEVLPHASVGRS